MSDKSLVEEIAEIRVSPVHCLSIGKGISKQIIALVLDKAIHELHLLDTGMNNYDVQSAIETLIKLKEAK